MKLDRFSPDYHALKAWIVKSVQVARERQASASLTEASAAYYRVMDKLEATVAGQARHIRRLERDKAAETARANAWRDKARKFKAEVRVLLGSEAVLTSDGRIGVERPNAWMAEAAHRAKGPWVGIDLDTRRVAVFGCASSDQVRAHAKERGATRFLPYYVGNGAEPVVLGEDVERELDRIRRAGP